MSEEIILPFETPRDRETSETTAGATMLELSPWVVQNIVYELLVNHCITNNQSVDGYTFTQKYDPDPTKSQVYLGIAYNWQTNPIGKRPAIIVFRENAQYSNPVMGQMTGINVPESEKEKVAFCTMNVGIAVLATGIGFVEDLADFLRKPLLQYQNQIQCDFRLMKFRLTSVSKPQIYLESKENFIVVLNVMIAFSDGWQIKGDDLKIKTISRTLFDQITNQPIASQ